MPDWNLIKWSILGILILFIGIPLWLYEKIFGHQPHWLD